MPEVDGNGQNPRRTTALVALILVLALLASPAAAQRKVEVYAPKHRAADELLPVVQGALHGSGDAVGDPHTGSLVLIGDPAGVAEAIRVLERLDRPPRTIVLRSDTRQLRELESRGFEVRWTAEAGDFRIGNVRRPLPEGSALEVRGEEAMQRLVESFGAVTRVLAGSSARIETGTSIPYASSAGHRPASARNRPPEQTGTTYVDVTSGFEASARILGDGRVQVDLALFAAQPGRAGRIGTTSASSSLIVIPGQTVAVAGLEGARDSSSQDRLRGARSATERDETILLLYVEIE